MRTFGCVAIVVFAVAGCSSGEPVDEVKPPAAEQSTVDEVKPPAARQLTVDEVDEVDPPTSRELMIDV